VLSTKANRSAAKKVRQWLNHEGQKQNRLSEAQTSSFAEQSTRNRRTSPYGGYISNRYIYVQLIDDDAQKTLCAVSSLGDKCTVETAKALGAKAAEAAKAKEITQVVFDRGGFTFGSRMRALTDSAREAGLKL